MAEDQHLAPLVEALTLDTRFAAAILFGSVARGTARPGSDIDIAVLYADEAARSSAAADPLTLFGQLGLTARRDVHLVDLERVDSALRRSIFGTGRTLFDRSARRLRELNAATLLEYFDWAYARRVIDEGHRNRLGHPGG